MTWSTAPTGADWDAAVAALTSGAPVLLLAHVSPDADALGSALAAALALEDRGVDVAVSFGDDPFVVPRTLRTLPGQHLLVPPTQVLGRAYDVVASFDVSSIERLGVLQQTAEAASTLVAVDHHSSYTAFGTVHVVDVKAPATAVLALELVDRLGVELDQDIATCVYSGIVTDTGSFKYVATTPDTHRTAARLLETGLPHDVIARNIYDDEPFAVLTMLGGALDRATLEPDAVDGRGLVHTCVSRAVRQELGLPLDAVERVIDVLRIATEAEVALVLKQADDGTWRVSMRSKGAVDVSQVALAMGGGGHRFAAGFTGGTDHQAVLADVRRLLDGLEPQDA